MSTGQNIAVITRFLSEVWNQGKASTIDELYHIGGVALGLGEEFKEGPAMFKMFHQIVTSTCTDIDVRVKDIMAEGDRVSYYATFDCTHRATGKKLHTEGGGFGTIRDGKIVEALNAWNFIDLVIQLGAAPPDVLAKALLETK